jgi:hypothetical protein
MTKDSKITWSSTLSNGTWQAHQLWGLSNLTLPHSMARLLAVEQIYRAHSLLTNHPYVNFSNSAFFEVWNFSSSPVMMPNMSPNISGDRH